MSYGDARQNRTAAIGAVVVVHAALGYALLTGLASQVFTHVVDGPMETYDVRIAPPPPPDPKPLPKLDKPASRPAETLTAPNREIVTPTDTPLVVGSIELPTTPIFEAPPGPAVLPEPAPAVSLARGVRPRGNQGDWFPQDSYPAAARRAEAEGRVSVQVTVGADGRISDCTVTASSGNADLDAATCRLARRNGRFEPARDPQGNPVTAQFPLRGVHWRLE
jgi:protein TonB